MKNDEHMDMNEIPEDACVSQEDEKKGKLLISCSLWLFALLLVINYIFRFNQHILFLVGGIVMMIGGTLQHFGFKLLKNAALGNLPVWEAFFGAAMAVMSIVFMIIL